MNQYNRTREIMNQLTNKVNTTANDQRYGMNKSILVVFTGTNSYIEEAVKVLMKGKGYGFRYDIVFTEAAETLIDHQKICQQLQPRRVYEETKDFYPEAILKGIDCIIAPLPTQNTAFKLAMGIQDQLVPRLLWEGIWNDIPVWMGLETLYQYKGKETKSIPLQNMITAHIEKLLQMGVKKIEDPNYLLEIFHNSNNKPSAVDIPYQEGSTKASKPLNLQKAILTEKDILNQPVGQSEIYIAHNSIITSLAQDAAKAKGIKIVKVNTPK